MAVANNLTAYRLMSERQKQTEFYKAVIQSDEQGDTLKLCDRIHKAEKDECCVRRAMCLTLLLAEEDFPDFECGFLDCLHRLPGLLALLPGHSSAGPQ